MPYDSLHFLPLTYFIKHEVIDMLRHLKICFKWSWLRPICEGCACMVLLQIRYTQGISNLCVDICAWYCRVPGCSRPRARMTWCGGEICPRQLWSPWPQADKQWGRGGGRQGLGGTKNLNLSHCRRSVCWSICPYIILSYHHSCDIIHFLSEICAWIYRPLPTQPATAITEAVLIWGILSLINLSNEKIW